MRKMKTLREKFKEFIDEYVETERVCLYMFLEEEQRKDNVPIMVIAKKSLYDSDEQSLYWMILKKFNLEDKAENFKELVTRFKQSVHNFKHKVRDFDNFQDIKDEDYKNLDSFKVVNSKAKPTAVINLKKFLLN